MTEQLELDCRGLVELVTDYLEDALAPGDRVRFEAHIADCSGCATHLDQMKQTIHLLGFLTEEHVSEAARRDLLRVLRSWPRSEGSPR